MASLSTKLFTELFRAKRKRKAAKSHSSKRHKANFTSGTMESSPAGFDNGDRRKRKHEEAELIPGVNGYTTFGFPDSIITKLRYCDSYRMTSTLGAVITSNFRANSIFDPYETGVGHQPMWRDNFAAIYNKYVVLGSKITVTFLNNSANNAVVGINGEDDTSSSTTVTTRMEMNNSVWAGMNSQSSSAGTQKLFYTYNPKEDLGSDVKDDQGSLVDVGSTPTEQWFYSVWGALLEGTTGTFDILVEIDYTVKFAELITQVQN